MKNKRISIGDNFGRLTVTGVSLDKKLKRKHWECKCVCGMKTLVSTDKLHSGHTRSCGCLAKELAAERMTVHGHKKSGECSPEYDAWCNMRKRCSDKRVHNWSRYGGRGISVCDRWKTSFVNFFSDMGERPSRSHSIDRIDTDGDYKPDNCRWATIEEQSRNRKSNRNLTYAGETKCLVDWSNQFGLKRKTLSKRLDRGWSVEKALTTPVRHSR